MSLYPKRDASADCTEKALCVRAMLRGRDEPTLGQALRGERPIGWVATSAVRLFLLAFVVSVSVTYVAQLPAEIELEAGGALHVLLTI